MTLSLHGTPLHSDGCAIDNPSKLQGTTLAQHQPSHTAHCAGINPNDFRQLPEPRPLHTLTPYGGACDRAAVTVTHTRFRNTGP